MAFRTLAGRVGRAGAAVGSATAGAVMVSPNQAHARAPPNPLPVSRPAETSASHERSKVIEDEWLLPMLDKDEVLFRPEDLAKAAEDLRLVAVNSNAFPLALHEDTSSDGSDGGHVNDIIELAEQTVMQQPGLNNLNNVNISPDSFNLLLDAATELLKRPRVQYELLDVIASHPTLRNHVLESAGIESGFFPPAAQPLFIEEEAEAEAAPTAAQEANQEEQQDVWGAVLAQIGDAFMTVGKKFNMAADRVGSWLQSVLKGRQAAESSTGSAEAEKAGAAPGNSGNALSGFMRATLVAAVVVACLVIARNPRVAVRVAKVVVRAKGVPV